jgi:putative PIN family toxin of toxin-antitoxin system
MISAVLDTVIFVRCLLNPSSIPGRIIVDHVTEFQLIVSEPVLNEIHEVLLRPEIRRRVRAFSRVGGAAIRARLAGATVVQVGVIPRVARDRKDDVFLATAAAGNADYLVTEDNDLLVLGTYGATAIVDAAMFLRILGA